MAKPKILQDRQEAKRVAVADRLREMQPQLDVLTGMWDERTLDMLIIILGIGHVDLD